MTTVPLGGLVLVTGANGYLATIVIKTLLSRGYQVRGTVRNLDKHTWMEAFFGPRFAIVEVQDMTHSDAFASAVEGVDGVLHMAANVAPGPEDEHAITDGIQAMKTLLNAANKSQSVKRVVLTSSVAACLTIQAGRPYTINKNAWNTEAIDTASQPWDGKDGNARSVAIYGALKARTEQEAFAWVEKNKPAFVFNSVVPDLTIGTFIAPEHMAYRNSSALMELFFRGNALSADILCAQWYINVEDAAYLQLGALTLDDVQSERIFGAAGRYSWNQILEIIKRRFPEHKTGLESVNEPFTDCGQINNAKAEEILNRIKGSGFKSLEETIVESGQSILEADKLPVPPVNPHNALAAAMASSS